MKIFKVSSGSAIDFAAEELKKYLRMMMPEENDIPVAFNPLATDGFRLGLSPISELPVRLRTKNLTIFSMLTATSQAVLSRELMREACCLRCMNI